MYEREAVLAEHYFYRFSAEVDNQVGAYRAVESLQAAGVPLGQIRIFRSTYPGVRLEIEPRFQEIAWALFKVHVILGLIGLVVGLAVATVLVVIGLAPVRSSPMMTVITLGFIYPVVAVFLADAVTPGQNHGLLMGDMRNATNPDHWHVVARCATWEQRQLVKATLGRSLHALWVHPTLARNIYRM